MASVQYQLPIAQPLTQAYVNRTDPRIETCFGYYAGNGRDWERRLHRLEGSASVRARSADVAAALQQYNEGIGASSRTLASIAAIAEGAAVVVGGQQAGLWTGPLLVIHKAVSIIGAAREASARLGTTIVPVFWIAGEDHDWDEANHAIVISAEQELRKLYVERPEGPRTSVSRTVVDEAQWEALLAELGQCLPHSEFKPHMLEKLEELAKGSRSLSDMFARLLAHLFAEEGLVVLDADDRALRAVESPMFRQLLERNDELEWAYASAAAQLKELGYPLQAEVTAGSANLFLFNPANGDERTLLFKRDGEFQDRKGIASWSKEELLRIAEEEPWQLSNNVMTRPLMQDYLFPVLATVLGPGEIAYWALTGDAFRTLDMEMPILVPRMSFTLIEGTIAKNMAKYELSFQDVLERFEERKEQWLKGQDILSIEARFGAVKSTFEDMYKPLLELASSIQPGLGKLGETNMAKILEQIGYMESKTADAHNKQFEASIRQLERIRLSLAPAGKPQERVVTMIGYWNRYGDAWLRKLLEAPYSPTGGHEIVYL